MAEKVSLEVRIGKVRLTTPLIGASGLFGYGNEYGDLLDYSCFGAIVSKTVTLAPREGNLPPRIVDVGSGLLNSIGLENVGSEAYLSDYLETQNLPCKLFASIGGAEVDEYRRLSGLFGGKPGIDAIEVNISCPNVKKGGIAFGRDPESTRQVLAAVRSETSLPLIAKVPPLISGIEDVCEAACGAGADALTVANTYPAMAIDPESERPVLGATSGGLSGGAIKPMTLFLVWKVARRVDVPILASGGIESAGDAIEYVLAGAHALQIGSVVLRNVRAPSSIMDGIQAYMKRRGHKRLDDFRGRATGQGKAS